MNILFGSSGLVGSFIAKQLKETEHKFLAVNRKKLFFLSDEELFPSYQLLALINPL